MKTGLPVWADAPAFCVHEALLEREIDPPLASDPLLPNRPLLVVAAKLAPLSTVKVPSLVVVVLASWRSSPLLTSTVAPAALVRFASRWLTLLADVSTSPSFATVAVDGA